MYLYMEVYICTSVRMYIIKIIMYVWMCNLLYFNAM